MDLAQVDQHEIVDLLGCSIELFEGLEKLQWYGKVNLDGFRNIFRKLDKVRSSSNGHIYKDELEFHNAEFASQRQCLKDLERINIFIPRLTRASVESQSSLTHFSLLLQTLCARYYPSFDSPNAAYLAILDDNFLALDHVLAKQGNKDQGSSSSSQPLLLTLLQCSVTQGSRKCIEKLLSQVDSLRDIEFAESDNYFHRLSISLGWRRKFKDQHSQQLRPNEPSESLSGDIEKHPLLAFVLDRLRPDQRCALKERDSFGRMPLHYAAMYGLLEVTQLYLKELRDQEKYPLQTAVEAILAQDSDGHTPLGLGIIGGYPAVTRTLLEVYGEKDGTDGTPKYRNLQTILGSLLAIALKSDFAEIVQILIAHHANINHRGARGETALYIATQSGHEGYVKAIIQSSSCHKIDLDLPETVHGWTPLFVACVEGRLSILKVLLEAGANRRIRDQSGWTAKEHAVFRGHMEIAEWLAALDAGELGFPSSSAKFSAGARTPGTALTCAIQEKEQNSLSLKPSETRLRRYPTKECQILVTLGPSNLRKNVKAVDLSCYLSDHPYSTHPEIGYSLEIGAIGAAGSSQVVQVPLLKDMINEPYLFTTKDPNKVKLVFNIFRIANYSDSGSLLIGSGIALLHNLKEVLASKHESLIRDYTIPILAKATLKLIGCLTFSFMIVTPFPQQSVAPTATCGFWKKEGSTQVVGHRGSSRYTIFSMKVC